MTIGLKAALVDWARWAGGTSRSEAAAIDALMRYLAKVLGADRVHELRQRRWGKR